MSRTKPWAHRPLPAETCATPTSRRRHATAALVAGGVLSAAVRGLRARREMAPGRGHTCERTAKGPRRARCGLFAVPRPTNSREHTRERHSPRLSVFARIPTCSLAFADYQAIGAA